MYRNYTFFSVTQNNVSTRIVIQGYQKRLQMVRSFPSETCRQFVFHKRSINWRTKSKVERYITHNAPSLAESLQGPSSGWRYESSERFAEVNLRIFISGRLLGFVLSGIPTHAPEAWREFVHSKRANPGRRWRVVLHWLNKSVVNTHLADATMVNICDCKRPLVVSEWSQTEHGPAKKAFFSSVWF